LNLEVKRLEQKINMLEKQGKVQPSQDNRRNMVNKLEKGMTMSKLAPQQQMNPTHHRSKKKLILMKRLNMQEVYS
jgi:predicted transcriptional regulator